MTKGIVIWVIPMFIFPIYPPWETIDDLETFFFCWSSDLYGYIGMRVHLWYIRLEVFIEKFVWFSPRSDHLELSSFYEFFREDAIEKYIGNIIIENMFLILESSIDSFFIEIYTHDYYIFGGDLLEELMASFWVFFITVKSSVMSFLFCLWESRKYFFDNLFYWSFFLYKKTGNHKILACFLFREIKPQISALIEEDISHDIKFNKYRFQFFQKLYLSIIW